MFLDTTTLLIKYVILDIKKSMPSKARLKIFQILIIYMSKIIIFRIIFGG